MVDAQKIEKATDDLYEIAGSKKKLFSGLKQIDKDRIFRAAELLAVIEFDGKVLRRAQETIEGLQTQNKLLQAQRGANSGYDCQFCHGHIYGNIIGVGHGSGQKFAHSECYHRRISTELLSKLNSIPEIPDYKDELHNMELPLETCLSSQAGQENCDGDPYDTMQFAADYLMALRKALGEPTSTPVVEEQEDMSQSPFDDD